MIIHDMNNLPAHVTVYGENYYIADHLEDGEWLERRTVGTSSIRTRNPLCLNWQVIDIYSDDGVCIEARP
jgi:hypothetical protein